MVSFYTFSATFVAVLASIATAAPMERRAAPDNQVWVTSVADHCLILPRHRMSIGDSESPGNMRSFCTKPYSSSQGQLSSNFWKKAHFKKTDSYVQLTGCINPSAQSTLLSDDDGGQYDSNGGEGGRGNPEGSVCLGYASDRVGTKEGYDSRDKRSGLHSVVEGWKDTAGRRSAGF